MSRERTLRAIPETARTSSGFARGERNRLATARKQDGQAERIIQYGVPSRDTVLGTVDWRTRAHPELNELITDEEHRKTLIEFIDARISAANGDRTLINEFIGRTDPKSETYDFNFALLVDSLNTHFHIVLDCFPRKRK